MKFRITRPVIQHAALLIALSVAVGYGLRWEAQRVARLCLKHQGARLDSFAIRDHMCVDGHGKYIPLEE